LMKCFCEVDNGDEGNCFRDVQGSRGIDKILVLFAGLENVLCNLFFFWFGTRGLF
jgi:hypothetical protein